MSSSPFPVSEHLTSIALAYENKKLIADRVLPRIPVPTKKYKYTKYPKGQLFSVPETTVGRKSEPNQPDFTGEELTDRVDDRALLDFVPQGDIDEAVEGFDPKGKSAEWLMKLILLDHEIKTAGLVFNNATYGSGNKEQLSGTDQLNDFGSSKPLQIIQDALNTPLMRPNRMVLGQTVWSKLRSHPKIIESITATGTSTGLASRRAIADLFEIDEVIVGSSRANTAEKGQAADIQRLWGKDIALLYIDEAADTQNGVTFGGTPQFKERIAGEWFDKKPGAEGGFWVKTAEYIHEKVFASDVGYYIEDAVA